MRSMASASRSTMSCRASAPVDAPRPRRVVRAGLDAALALLDSVVDGARVAAPRVALRVERPALVAVAAPPLAGGRARLVPEAHRDAVVGKAPALLPPLVVAHARP